MQEKGLRRPKSKLRSSRSACDWIRHQSLAGQREAKASDSLLRIHHVLNCTTLCSTRANFRLYKGPTCCQGVYPSVRYLKLQIVENHEPYVCGTDALLLVSQYFKATFHPSHSHIFLLSFLTPTIVIVCRQRTRQTPSTPLLILISRHHERNFYQRRCCFVAPNPRWQSCTCDRCQPRHRCRHGSRAW